MPQRKQVVSRLLVGNLRRSVLLLLFSVCTYLPTCPSPLPLPRCSRSRAQARVEGTEEQGEEPAKVMAAAAAAAGLNSVRLGMHTPSTTHNSLQSSESATGLGLSGRTPVGQGRQAANGGGKDRNGVTVSVKGSDRERKKIMASPSALQAYGGPGIRGGRRRTSDSSGTSSGLNSDGVGLNG